MARIVEAIGRWRSGRLSCLEAAEVLGMSERHFRRLRDRYEAEGAEGLIDRRRGRVSGRRVASDRIEWLLEQYRTRYFDFTFKHFHERLVAEHSFALGYTWTKRVLQNAGLVRRASRRSAHRKKRPRRPLPGMLLFQDGSSHAWLEGQAPLDLIVTLDDATSEISSAFLVEEEGTQSSLRGLGEVIGRHGLFSSLYSDRGSHYFVTPKAGGKVAKAQRTQVGRALEQLGMSTYRPTRRRRGGGWSGCSARCKAVCRRSCGWPGSPPPRRRTAGSRTTSWRRTMPASRSRRRSPAARSWRLRVIWPRSCACRRSVWSATTTACATAS
jgi:transposase